MPVYDKRYEDQPAIEYVNVVLKLISPYGKNGMRMSPPRFGKMELNNDQLGFMPVYVNYEDAVRDYPNTVIYQVRVSTKDDES